MMNERTNIETKISEAVQNMKEASRRVKTSSLGTVISTAIIGFGTYGASKEKIGYVPVILAGVVLLLKFGGDLLKCLNQRYYYKRTVEKERNKLRVYDESRSTVPVAGSIENL